ncbi:MAG: hypothetical protein ACREUL_01680 [Steroidobacteraceae bacterium]
MQGIPSAPVSGNYSQHDTREAFRRNARLGRRAICFVASVLVELLETDTRRYFPEWADLSIREGIAAEADRNSYSAAGYAEEFGYRLQSGLPPPAPTLEGNPEHCQEWHCLMGALHPGYPERATPLDHDPDPLKPQRYHGPKYTSVLRRSPSENFKVIRVGKNRAAGTRERLPQRLGAWWRALPLLHRKPDDR